MIVRAVGSNQASWHISSDDFFLLAWEAKDTEFFGMRAPCITLSLANASLRLSPNTAKIRTSFYILILRALYMFPRIFFPSAEPRRRASGTHIIDMVSSVSPFCT